MKYHASRKTLDKAGQAYEELFASDIFKLPESQSEYDRVTIYESHQDADSGFIDDFEDDLPVAPAATENAPSTLPQILHLSFKNRAEYYLDVLRVELEEHPPGQAEQTQDKIIDHARRALKDFADALDKDEDNVDVWRRAAKLSKALNSCRTARYCLEATLEDEDEGADDVLGLPNFERRFDEQALSQLQAHMEDDLTIPSAALNTTGLHQQSKLQRAADVYEFLPQAPSLRQDARQRMLEANTVKEKICIQVEEHTMDAIGEALLRCLQAQQEDASDKKRVTAVTLELPAPGHDDPFKHNWDIASHARGSDTAGTSASSHRPSHTPVAQTPVVETRPDSRHLDVPDTPDQPEDPPQRSPQKPEAPRKRSSEAAGLMDGAEGERGKSKRIRARKSTTAEGRATETSGLDLTPGGDPRHETYLQADRWLFDLMRDVLRRMEVRMIYNADDIRRILVPNSPYGLVGGPRRTGIGRACQDFYAAMLTWSSSKTDMLINSIRQEDDAEGKTDAGLLAFLDSTSVKMKKSESFVTSEVETFVRFVNSSSMNVEQTSVLFCQVLLSETRPHVESEHWPEPVASPYTDKLWRERLKEIVEHISEIVDQDLIDYVTIDLPQRITDRASQLHAFDLVQSLFELRLDMYARTIAPAAETGPGVKAARRSKVQQWSHLAREMLAIVLFQEDGELDDVAPSTHSHRALLLRHLWASVFNLKASDEITRDYHVQCINDLKNQIKDAALPNGRIVLPNNHAMPEISIEAADREIVKLDTMDFFLSIFQEEQQHPVDLIENLEPILIPTAQIALHEGQERRRGRKNQSSNITKSRQEILSEFVTKADVSLKLTLWYRLRDSYMAIDFPSKVLFVNLRILEVLMGELQSQTYVQAEADDRERTLLQRLHDIHGILIQTSEILEAKDVGLDCLDIAQLKTSAQNLISLFTLLHAVTLFDDHSQAVQKGSLLTNPFRTYSSESFHPASIQLHEMQVRNFILMYKLMAEAAAQMPEKTSFAQANVDRYEYLQYVHYALGVRRLCKSSDNLFLKFMWEELNQLHAQPITDDVAQILYDLYDLKCFTSTSERQDHGCEPDYLDRNTAMDLVDFVLERTKGTNLKDLPKADLGKSVEKLQVALGAPPTTFNTSRNKRMISSYMKSPISPLELFNSLQGVGSLSTTACPPSDAPIASKGWYFLIGMINLAKHKRAREGDSAKISDDVNTAAKFFTHDLEYDAEKWETWFRLGHGYDWLHEEECLWQADKFSNKDVVQLQRSALHAYSQSTALALRFADDTEDTKQKLGALHLEFAIRVYSSARPPFSMQAFDLTTFMERLQSVGNNVYTRQHFCPLRSQQALRIAATLCRRAIAFKPFHWLNHFMLGKALWKMFLYIRSRGNIEIKLAIDALGSFHQACEVLERRRDPNRTDPTLEPIYKIVFVVEKMVSKQVLSPTKGAEHIASAWKAQKQVDNLQKVPDLESGQTFKDYAIKALKMVRAADRNRWHHRVPHKIAQLTYESLSTSPDPNEGAKQAKEYLDKQNMYSTKTGQLAVWKPDIERPGRHWVYMTRYARFLVKLLDETDDLEIMQLFARRVRKKTNEYHEHAALWEYVLESHLRVHRRSQKIPFHAYSSVFSDMNVEQFKPRADAVDVWACDPATKHPLVELLREIEEIKKVNAKLASETALDDLICDVFATIYSGPGKDLPITERKDKDRPEASAGVTPATGTPEPSAVPTPEKPKAMALSNLMNATDGSSDVPTNIWRPVATSGGLSNAPLSIEPAPRPRAPRSVTRRDVLKKALDASIVKVTAVKDNPEKERSKGQIKVIINLSKERPTDTEGSETGKEKDKDTEVNGDGGSDASSELSDPDVSADDEMEVDEGDEDEGTGDEEEKKEVKAESPIKNVASARFPGLAGRRSISKAAEERAEVEGSKKDGEVLVSD